MLCLPALGELEVAAPLVATLCERLAHYQAEGYATAPEDTSTVEGFQTPNLLGLEDLELDAALADLLALVEGAMPLRFDYHWVHLIDYESGGFQREHDHCHNEDYSFVVYLNDASSGQTRFYLNPAEEMRLPVEVEPRAGRMVVFMAQLRHAGRRVVGRKQVLVAGLRVREAALEPGWRLRPRRSRRAGVFVSPEQVARVVSGVALERLTRFDAAGEATRSVTLRSAAGELFELDASQAAIVDAVDGARCVADIVALLTSGPDEDLGEVTVFEQLRNLVGAEILALDPLTEATGTSE